MIYGLLGEKLGHSFSKDIHQKIVKELDNKYQYQLIEVSKDNFDEFMMNRNFKALNVTIPYKEKVIKYLDYIDDKALEINAVNTIVNKDNKLYGYNTDYLGLKELIIKNNIDVSNKKILILGTGGTSKTASVVLKDLNAKEIFFVTRNKSVTVSKYIITYQEANKLHNDAEIIINTTPCGMFPNVDEVMIDLNEFFNLESVIDVIYNPLQTKLLQVALNKGVKAVNGLYMLVAQAVYASKIFIDKTIDSNVIDKVYEQLLNEKQNIVLIGMPSCGKSTIGKMLASLLGKKFVDSDTIIEEKLGMKISQFLTKENEFEFRNIESEVIKELSIENNLIIATGGGVIKRDENIKYLKFNGKMIFIDRKLELLQSTSSRPLSSNINDLKNLYNQRYPLYHKYADYVVVNNDKIENVVDEIINYINVIWRGL